MSHVYFKSCETYVSYLVATGSNGSNQPGYRYVTRLKTNVADNEHTT